MRFNNNIDTHIHKRCQIKGDRYIRTSIPPIKNGIGIGYNTVKGLKTPWARDNYHRHTDIHGR